KPDIAFEPVLPLNGEPVDELLGSGIGQIPKRAAPSAELNLGAPLQPANDGFDARALRRVELLRALVLEPPRQDLGEPQQRARQARERRVQSSRRLEQTLDRRACLGLEAVARLDVAGTRHHLLTDEKKEGLGRAQGAAFGEAVAPTVARQGARRDGRGVERLLGLLVSRDEILDATTQAARPTTAAFVAENPAPQLRRLEPRQVER